MIETLLLIASTARYAAAGLLLIAATGKVFSLAGPTTRSRPATALLASAEIAIGFLLLAPVSGLPIWAAAAMFTGFAGAQVIGRTAGPSQPCGCYGSAAPNAVYSYGAFATFVVLALAIASTTVLTSTLTTGALDVARAGGVGLAAAMMVRVRREQTE